MRIKIGKLYKFRQTGTICRLVSQKEAAEIGVRYLFRVVAKGKGKTTHISVPSINGIRFHFTLLSRIEEILYGNEKA